MLKILVILSIPAVFFLSHAMPRSSIIEAFVWTGIYCYVIWFFWWCKHA